MKLKCIIIATFLLISANCFSQQLNPSKTITRLDSLFKFEVGSGLSGMYEYCQVNIKNTSATKTDSIRFWHINEDGDTSLLSFYVLNRVGLRSDDSLKQVLMVEPTTSYPSNRVEILINMPFPYKILAELFNAENTALKSASITGRFKNRP